MMLLLNCALGLVHPPVGTVQFVGCAIGNISIGEATRDRLAVLPGDLGRDQPGHLRAGVLHLAAVADHRAPGVLKLRRRAHEPSSTSPTPTATTSRCCARRRDGALRRVERFAAGGTVMPLAVQPRPAHSLRVDPLRPVSVAAASRSIRDGRLDAIGRRLCRRACAGSGPTAAAASCSRPPMAPAWSRSARSTPAASPARRSRPSPRRRTRTRCRPIPRIASCSRPASAAASCASIASTPRAAASRQRRRRPGSARPAPGRATSSSIRRAPFVYLLNELDAPSTCSPSMRERGKLRGVQTSSTLPLGFRRRRALGRRHPPHARRPLPLRERAPLEHARGLRRRCGERRADAVGHVPTETQPRGFAIIARGRWLVAVGQLSQRARRYAIDRRRAARSTHAATFAVGTQSELGRDRRARRAALISRSRRDRARASSAAAAPG